jgi:integral membrane sensor domain MASE1
MNILKKIFEYIILVILLVVAIAFLIFSAFLIVKYPTQTIAFTLLFAFLVRTK